MTQKDRDAIRAEPELSQDRKDAIVAIAKMGGVVVPNPFSSGASGHMDPSESSIRESTDAEIQSHKPNSDGKEFRGDPHNPAMKVIHDLPYNPPFSDSAPHPRLADSLMQIIAAHPDAKGLTEQVAKLIIGGRVSYEDQGYRDVDYVINTKEEAQKVAAELIETIKNGHIRENSDGRIESDFHIPDLCAIIASADDRDIKAHLVPAQSTRAINTGASKTPATQARNK